MRASFGDKYYTPRVYPPPVSVKDGIPWTFRALIDNDKLPGVVVM
jgi:hypothetical protein